MNTANPAVVQAVIDEAEAQRKAELVLDMLADVHRCADGCGRILPKRLLRCAWCIWGIKEESPEGHAIARAILAKNSYGHSR